MDEEDCQVKNGTEHTRQRKGSIHYKICKMVATILGLVPIFIGVWQTILVCSYTLSNKTVTSYIIIMAALWENAGLV